MDGLPIIGNLLKPPKTEAPPVVLPAPTPPPPAAAAASDPAANAARAAALAAGSKAKGRQSTLLNGGAGVTGDAPVKRSTLFATPKQQAGS